MAFTTGLLLLFAVISCTECLQKRLDRSDSVYKYCMQVSLKMDQLQAEIIRRTIRDLPVSGMLAGTEVLQLGQNLLRLIRARRVLDIGTFTGLSAVSWALATPINAQILTMDVNPTYYDRVTRAVIEPRPEVARKIRRYIGLALTKLDSLIAAGEAGTWDFAFIDADKINYPNYYERLVTLLRPGGVIIIDNSLWGGRVAGRTKDASTTAIDRTNWRAANDNRTDNFLLPIADGAHIIFKKHRMNDY